MRRDAKIIGRVTFPESIPIHLKNVLFLSVLYGFFCATLDRKILANKFQFSRFSEVFRLD